MSTQAAALMQFALAAPAYGLKPEWQGRVLVIEACQFRLFGIAELTSERNVVLQCMKTQVLVRISPAHVIRAFAVKGGA